MLLFLEKLFELLGGLNKFDWNNQTTIIMRRLNYADAKHAAIEFYIRMLRNVLLINSILFSLTVIIKDLILVILSLFITITYYFLQIRSLNQKLIRRQTVLLYHLPDLINKWLMRLSSGESLLNVIRNTKSENQNPTLLDIEVDKIKDRIQNGVPLANALDGFAKNCNIIEINKLSYLLQLHIKNGGSDLYSHLNIQLDSLWASRKYIAKKYGEEISSKMTFPLIFIFMTLMFILAAPIVFFTK